MWLAVTLGVLIANALGAALFGGDDAAEPPGGAVEAAAAENDEAPAVAEANSAQATIAANQPAPTKALPTLEPVSLPGPSSARRDGESRACIGGTVAVRAENGWEQERSEEHTSELQSLMRISYAVFCLKKKKKTY